MLPTLLLTLPTSSFYHDLDSVNEERLRKVHIPSKFFLEEALSYRPCLPAEPTPN